MNVGEKIRKARESKGLSQQELGEMIGVTQSYIGQVERGTKAPHFALVAQIAKVLKIKDIRYFEN